MKLSLVNCLPWLGLTAMAQPPALRIPDFITPSWTNSDTSSIAIIPTFTLTFRVDAAPPQCEVPLSPEQVSIIQSFVQQSIEELYKQYLGSAGKAMFFKAELQPPIFEVVGATDIRTKFRGRNGGRRRSLVPAVKEDLIMVKRELQTVSTNNDTVVLLLTFADGDAHFRFSPPPSDQIQTSVLEQFLADQSKLNKLRNDLADQLISQNLADLCSEQVRGPSTPAFATLSISSQYTENEIRETVADVPNQVPNSNSTFEFTEQGSNSNNTILSLGQPPNSVQSVTKQPSNPWYENIIFIAGMTAVGGLLLLFFLITSIVVTRKRKRFTTVKRMEAQYENDLAGRGYNQPNIGLYDHDPMQDHGQMYMTNQKSVLQLVKEDDESSYEGDDLMVPTHMLGGGERVVTSSSNSLPSHRSATFGGQSSVDGYGVLQNTVQSTSVSRSSSLSSGAAYHKLQQDMPQTLVSEDPRLSHYLDTSLQSSFEPVPPRAVSEHQVSQSSFDRHVQTYLAGGEMPAKYGGRGIEPEEDVPLITLESVSEVAAIEAFKPVMVPHSPEETKQVGSMPIPGADPTIRHASLADYDVCARTHYSSETGDSIASSPAFNRSGSFSSAGVQDGSMTEDTPTPLPRRPISQDRKSPWNKIASAIPADEQVIARTQSVSSGSTNSRRSNLSNRERSATKVKPAIPGQASLSKNNQQFSTKTIQLDDVISLTSGASGESSISYPPKPPSTKLATLNPFQSSERELSPLQEVPPRKMPSQSGSYKLSPFGQSSYSVSEEDSLTGSKLDLFKHSMNVDDSNSHEMDALRKMNLVKKLHLPAPQSFRKKDPQYTFQIEGSSSGDKDPDEEDMAYERILQARRLRR